MREITMIGLDLAKNVFQLHAVDKLGNAVMKKTLRRDKLLAFIASLPGCLIVMETCSGAHFWAREFIRAGHRVKLISPKFVRPFVKTNKNDAADAEAICEAALRPSMRFVPIKSTQQIDLQTLHRVRQSCVRRRTALANQMRGHLAEYGFVLPQGVSHVRNRLPHLLDDYDIALTMPARDYLSDLYAEFSLMDDRIGKYNLRLAEMAKNSERCKRLMSIPGVGVLTATILMAVAGDGSEFKNGRHFAAWLGLVPRQHSSGGKSGLRGISKRGDTYIRTLLIQGAHNLVRRDATPWLAAINKRRGYTRACVAQANKTARIAWAVLAKNEVYQAA